ncbi:hypothetical protein Tco_0622956 [Tanacetum coccineum]
MRCHRLKTKNGNVGVKNGVFTPGGERKRRIHRIASGAASLAGLQPGGWEVAGGIFLFDFSFKALARVVLGRGPSYFTISSLQLDLRSWELE